METTTKRLTIYDIKRLSAESAPYFFSSKTLKFFGQTMRSFSVRKQADGRYRISAPAKGFISGQTHYTVRYFNPITNQLDHE